MPGALDAHDATLERAMIHSVIYCPENLAEPWSNLPDEAFYLESHRVWWKHIRRLHAQGSAVDLVTIHASMHEKDDLGHWEKPFTALVGEGLNGFHPIAIYGRDYAMRLKAIYGKRVIASAAQKIQGDLASGADSAEARLEFDLVSNAMDEIGGDGSVTDEALADMIGDAGRYKTGFGDVDRTIGGFAKPGLVLVVARPTVGKSAFARSVIRKAAARKDHVLWFSLDQALNQIMELEVARAEAVPTRQIETWDRNRKLAAIRKVKHDVWGDRVHVIDQSLPIHQMLTVAKVDRPDLMVVDYVQIIDTGHDDEYESITHASKALKNLALQLRIPILALAQFNRQQKPGVTPNMSNLRGSGQLEQDADQILALDRDTSEASSQGQPAKLHIIKSKVGPTGVVDLSWVGKWATYESAPPSHFR